MFVSQLYDYLCMYLNILSLQRKCQLKYEAIGSNGWYAVALQIEDFASPTATVPLSSVPVQFLVLVFSSNEPCSQKPEFVGVTRVAGSCIGVPFNTTFHEPLIAISGGPDVRCVLRAFMHKLHVIRYKSLCNRCGCVCGMPS